MKTIENMILVTDNVIQRRRGSRSQLSFQSDTERVLADSLIVGSEHNRQFWNRRNRIFSVLSDVATMHRSTKTALIAIAILLCVVLVILLLNLGFIASTFDNDCIKIDGEESCYAEKTNPYRMYGTKTAYHIVNGGNNSLNKLNIEDCTPVVFYLYCRHATRYPDREDIEEMIKLLPVLKNQIHNNSLVGKIKMCNQDIQNLEDWVETLNVDDDKKISEVGVKETILLAQRFKSQFPELLGKNYSPEKFTFEFTSRERTKNTAESFAQGLFDKKINFNNTANDVLQFHKDCKNMQKRCNDKSYDISEIEKFQNGPLMQKVIDSVSARIGVSLKYEELKTIYKACAFGYALERNDTWCSLFTTDELKVFEFDDDIDDYYKDAYGNEISYKQACPVVKIVMDLFKTFTSTSKNKALLQFSHAGGIKKVYSIFGLFKDEKPMKADSFCSQQNRKWRSSFIAPFTSNLALVLYNCSNKIKVAAYHNEIPVKLNGCTDIFCSYDEFYEMYNPIAEECDLKKICCTCCLD